MFVGALVSLLTLDPAEYGPSGQINMKVVKTLVPADADSETDCTGEQLKTFTSFIKISCLFIYVLDIIFYKQI